MADEGDAEVALQRFDDKTSILDIPWAVEAHLHAELLDLRYGHPIGRLPKNDLGWVSGHEEHPESNDTDAEDDDQGLQHAANGVTHDGFTASSEGTRAVMGVSD